MITIIILAALAMPSLLFVMLLPALLELKKPKDAGPRLIISDSEVPDSNSCDSFLQKVNHESSVDNKPER